MFLLFNPIMLYHVSRPNDDWRHIYTVGRSVSTQEEPQTDNTFFIRLYRLILGLYPAEVRDRLGEEMVTVFAEALSEARANGRVSAACLLIRELITFPGSLLLAYARSWRTLSPQPVEAPGLSWIAGWTGVGCAAMPIAWLLAAPLGVLLIFLFSIPVPGQAAGLSSNVFMMLGFVTGLGLTSATMQWLLLRRHLPHAGWWIPVSFAGWAVSGLLLFTLDRLFHAWLQEPLPMLALLGATVGFAQWLLLRRLLPNAFWWPLLNMLAFSTILLAGESFSSLAEMLLFLTLPHLVTGIALWALLQQELPAAPVSESDNIRSEGLRSGRLVAGGVLLLLLTLLVAGPWAYASAQIELAKRDGIYASPEEGFRVRAAAVEGAQLVRIEGLSSGPNWGDGRLPHVGFASGRVFYDRPPVGWDKNTGYPGSFYIHVRGGWVHMSEGVFPGFVGRVMELYNLEGAGED